METEEEIQETEPESQIWELENAYAVDSSGSGASSSYSKLKIWNRSAILALTHLYKKYEPRMLTKEMNDKGFSVTVSQCRDK